MVPRAPDQSKQAFALNLFQPRQRGIPWSRAIFQHLVEVLGVAISKTLLTRHADEKILGENRKVIEDVAFGQVRYGAHQTVPPAEVRRTA